VGLSKPILSDKIEISTRHKKVSGLFFTIYFTYVYFVNVSFWNTSGEFFLVPPGVFNLDLVPFMENFILPPSVPITKNFRTDWVNPNQPPTDYINYLLDYSFNKIQNVVGYTISSGIYNSIDAGLVEIYLTPVQGLYGNIFIREPNLLTFPIVNTETVPNEGTPLVNDTFFDRIIHNFSTNSFMYCPSLVKRVTVQIQVYDPLFNTPPGASIEVQTSFTIHVMQK